MSTPSLVYMIAVLGLVWGGFGVCLYLLATQEEPEDSEPESDR